MAAGDFSAGQICTLNYMVEEAFTSDTTPLARERKGFNPTAAILVKQDSEANTDLDNGGKFFMANGMDKSIPSVNLRFVKPAITEAACSDACDITGAESEAAYVTLNLALCRQFSATVKEASLESNSYTKDEVAAKALMKMLMEADNWWDKQVLLFLKANQGAASTGSLLSNWTWDAVNKRFDIASANYNVKLIAELMLMRELNNIQNAYVVDSGALWLNTTNSTIDGATCCGAGDAQRAEMLDLNFDIKGFAAAALAETSYHIAEGSIGFVNYNKFGFTPEVINASNLRETRYAIASPKIPNMVYDVRYQYKCVGGKFEHTWQLQTRGGLMVAPTGDLFPQGGTVKDTGIVALKKA